VPDQLTLRTPQGSCPLLITALPETSVDYLVGWLSERRAHLARALVDFGAVLFRGMSVRSAAQFRTVVEAFSTPLDYIGGISPRRPVAEKVYESTYVPADHMIFPHNELCHVATPPDYLWFFCVTPSSAGGETPLFPSRRVLDAMSADTKSRLLESDLRYSYQYWSPSRPIPAGSPVKTWPEAFGTSRQANVDRMCRDLGLSSRWEADGGLHITSTKAAVTTHPVTGDRVWFNQILLRNGWRLQRTAAVEKLREDDATSQCSYADGSSIATEDVAEIWRAMRAAGSRFQWHKGDILLVDNLSCGHGRMPYWGNRELLCILTERAPGAGRAYSASNTKSSAFISACSGAGGLQ
jgi:alpha-ketoglutarate-dependent taurine dioxygenase